DHRPALQRTLPGLGMLASVIDRLDPGGEQRVQLGHVGQLAARADLDEELFPYRAEQLFDLPPAGRLPGPGMDEPDAQARAGALQLLVDHRRSVVEVDRVRDAAGGKAVAQRG